MDLSGKIDPSILRVLRHVSDAAEELNTPFFLVGATARDLLLEKGHDQGCI